MSLKYKLKRLYRRLHPNKSRYEYVEGDDGIERHHDPYWFHAPEVDPSEHEKPDWYVKAKLSRDKQRDTDYSFPEWWGTLEDRVERGEMTKEEMWERKSQWFLTRRVWRQINRQYDAGMWDQWGVETLRDGLTPRETVEELSKSDYRYNDD